MYTYKYYTDKENRKVVLCLRKYKGKTIKGRAVCHAEDTYDEEVGKNLARMRCDSALWEKKVRNKYIYKEMKRRNALQANADYAKAEEVFSDVCKKYIDVQKSLSSYIEELRKGAK